MSKPDDTGAVDVHSERAPAASAGEHKVLHRRWIDAYNDRDEAVEAEVRAPEYVAYAPGEPEPLRDEAWRALISSFVDAMPDLRITIEDLIAEGDLTAARNTFSGTHTGEFQGLPPSNRRITFSGLEFNRLVDGKVVEHWFQLDQPALFKQLGLVVTPGPRLLIRILVHRLRRLPGAVLAKRSSH
jgi:predicted ester cyclase